MEIGTVNYRLARMSDAERIAGLHVRSWQQFYRGLWSDYFLDHLAGERQLEVWTDILKNLNEEQHLVIAESAGKLVGFSFTRLNENQTWGSFLDNLHVAADWQGLGIGRYLIKESAEWVLSGNPESDYYLFVLEKNFKSRAFYNKCGAREVEILTESDSEKGEFGLVRCFWEGAKIV